MKKGKRLLALFMALTMILGLAGCGGQKPQPTEGPTASSEVQTTAEPTAAPTETQTEAPSETETEADYTEEFPPVEDGCNQLVLYWHSDGNPDISTSDVWIWWGDVAGKGYPFLPCAYGFKCVVNVPEDVSEVGFIVRTHCSEPGGTSWGSATKDFDADRFALITGKETHVYLVSGDALHRPVSFRLMRSAIPYRRPCAFRIFPS